MENEMDGKCETCGGDLEYARVKDIELEFDSRTVYVTLHGWICAKCKTLETDTD